jgi:Mycothiol maleylpyruvate isomerase N-terminal domain
MTTAFDQAAQIAALDAEESALHAVLERYDDAALKAATRADGWSAHDIVAHLADATYGLALMLLGEIPVSLPIDSQTGWMNADEYNEQRRQKNAGLSHAKLGERLAGAFVAARRSVSAEVDSADPGPSGAQFTRADWHQRMIDHLRDHRVELEELLA